MLLPPLDTHIHKSQQVIHDIKYGFTLFSSHYPSNHILFVVMVMMTIIIMMVVVYDDENNDDDM